MRYAIFPGCTILARLPSYELSTRKVLGRLGVELLEMENTNCCAPPGILSIDWLTGLTLSARNLCIAEEMGLDILTLCSGCYETLSKTNELLKADVETRRKVNEVLGEVGKEFKGKVKVRHLVDVLYNDVGTDKLGMMVKRSFKGLRTAVYYGCHLLKPSVILKLDNPERPRVLDELVEVTEAKSIHYSKKLQCCGGLLRGISDEMASRLAREKLQSAIKEGAACIVTVCPFCFIQFDLGQLEMIGELGGTVEERGIPVFHYPEFLGLSFGFSPEDLGIHTHKVKVSRSLTG